MSSEQAEPPTVEDPPAAQHGPTLAEVLTPDELRRARGVRELIRRRVYTDEG